MSFASAGFVSLDSTNCGSKIFQGKKIPETSKKQNLNLLCAKHYAEYTLMKQYPAVAYLQIQIICKEYAILYET